MRVRVVVLGLLAAATLSGCATSPEQVEEIRRVWAERDAERARECVQRRGRFVAGACQYGGGI